MNTKSFWYPSIVGFICMLMGLAFCRFSYTPMIPFLVHSNWLSSNQANYIGSFNFAGYFIGAVLAFTVSKKFDRCALLKVAFLLACLSLLCCGFNFGFAWTAIWRLIAGVVGAFLVILSPSLVMHRVSSDKMFLASGLMFTGAGAGVVFSSLVLPVLAQMHTGYMWFALGLLSVLLTIVIWPFFNGGSFQKEASKHSTQPLQSHFTLITLAIAYFLCGIGVVPHTLFLSHYLYVDFHFSPDHSGSLFGLFGLGCVIGSFLGGVLARKTGVHVALMLSYLCGFVAVLMVVLSHHSIWVLVSAVFIGVFLFACVNLTSLRTRELASAEQHPKYWGRITLCFAIGQAIGAYGMSALIAHGYTYIEMFWVAVVALLGGAIALIK